MRRGHSRSSWRNDNPGHFAPRSSGPSNFRPNRNYQNARFETPRYAPMFQQRSSYSGGSSNDISRFNSQGYNPRNKFYRGYPPHQEERLEESNHMYERRQNKYSVNHMKDVNHHAPYQQRYQQKPPPLLERDVDYRQFNHQPLRRDSDNAIVPPSEYSGHRPPASDHYDDRPGPDNEHSNTFSRSVDDTVDLVRRKLLNRNDPTPEVSEPVPQEDFSNDVSETDTYNQSESEKTNRKKNLITKRINVSKMKSKIFNQFFKMDKDRIHKFMDNPNTSSKFEYAVNSLITESQNSLNRHLRAAAEKSLCVSQSSNLTQFSESDSIYEDTFMKQMQCLLDPRDTVLLEDIKPFVMAELNKVLELDVPDNRCNPPHESNIEPHDYGDFDERILPDYHHEPVYNQDEYNEAYHESKNMQTPYYDIEETQYEQNQSVSSDHSSSHNKIPNYDEPERVSADKSVPEVRLQEGFDPNTEQLTDEDDPFEELDRQYHVAVGVSYIDADDSGASSQKSTPKPETPKQTNIINKYIKREPNVRNINFPVSFMSDQNKNTPVEDKTSAHTDPSPAVEPTFKAKAEPEQMQENSIDSVHEEIQKPDSSSHALDTSNESKKSRKRTSSEQKHSHRKEKRKKSDSHKSNTVKSSLSSYFTLVKVSRDSNNSHIDSRDSSLSNEDKHKEHKTPSSSTEYSEKYVKRKSNKKSKDISEKSVSKHSTPKKSGEITSTKTEYNHDKETKSKFIPIDIFEQPKKPAQHTRQNSTESKKPMIEEKIKTIPPKTISKQITRRHTASQTTFKTPKKSHVYTQTISEKYCDCPTPSQKLNKHVDHKTSSIKATDPLERMKEIDLEIQKLLQEKFKLYNSIESKDVTTSTMPTLGMTVLNFSDTNAAETNQQGIKDSNKIQDSEDTIVDDFANIPTDMLKEIAIESIANEKISPPKTRRKTNQRETRSLNVNKSESPVQYTRKQKKKVEPINISLIEQIITDDRPIEEIISLDDLETSPVKSKSKKAKAKKPKKVKETIKLDKKITPVRKNTVQVKECSVVLSRVDVNKYLKEKQSRETIAESNTKSSTNEEIIINDDEDSQFVNVPNPILEIDDVALTEEIHFEDMLGVSEDIIIGEVCDVTLENKDDSTVASDDVVIDNSQFVETPVTVIDNIPTVNTRKMYDFSVDEDLKHDSIAVSGNADAVLAIECVEQNFLAACLDGTVYYYSSNGQLLRTLRGSNLAVTCLTIVKDDKGITVYTGSLDSRIRYYNLETGLEKGPECNVLSPIQSMDRAWDTVFVGTRTGFVLQFECKNNILIPVSTVKFSDQSILALRALKEGARKVLLVASRSENVTIKDARTGLLLRTLEGPKMTVYTLLYEDGKVYCGTSSNMIQVFDYSSGSHMGSHEGGKGAVCLRCVGGLLLAGCYDGCVYIYRSGEPQPFAQLRGPGVMLLSLAVIGNKIIVGYKDRSMYIWKIPEDILQEMIL